jgi:hypothetical protein
MASVAISRRDAAPTPHPRPVPSMFAPVRRLRHPSPEAGRNPRLCSFRGRPRPRRVGVRARATRWCTAGAMLAGHALLRSGGPAVTSHPCAPYHGRGITPSSPLVGSFPYLRARPSSSRRPTSLPPFSRAVVAAAGKPSPCIVSEPPRA